MVLPTRDACGDSPCSPGAATGCLLPPTLPAPCYWRSGARCARLAVVLRPARPLVATEGVANVPWSAAVLSLLTVTWGKLFTLFSGFLC